jgi:hypothetical protein
MSSAWSARAVFLLLFLPRAAMRLEIRDRMDELAVATIAADKVLMF